jgi:hypothetical protein
MKGKEINAADMDIPVFNDLVEFYKHINASASLNKEVDIREIMK